MELSVFSNKKADHKIKVSNSFFGREFNQTLVQQVVTAYLSDSRKGKKAKKNRSECRGGGSKPWRQKGTGRARSGTSRSPLWRGGGVTFFVSSRNYSQKVNRKAYRVAISSIFSQLIRQNRLLVAASLTLSIPKTKQLLTQLESFDVDRVLLVIVDRDLNLELAARNLPNVDVATIHKLSPVQLIAKDHVVISEEALKRLEEKFS